MSQLSGVWVLLEGVWVRKGRMDTPPPPPPPPPSATKPYYGSCPTSGGGSPQATRNKYGEGTSIRVFMTSLTERPASRPNGSSIMWWSYKPTPSALLSGSLDSQLRSVLDDMRPGDVLTFHHERDNDGIDGNAAAVQEWKNENNYLYDFTKAYKPSVLTGPVFTGGLMANYTSASRRNLWCTGIKGDIFGVDCDGVHIRDASHPNEMNYNRIQYTDELNNCQAYMAHPSNEGFQKIGVAEFITARKNPPDPTGSIRAGWMSDQCDIFEEFGVYAVCVYDFAFGTHNTANDMNLLPNPSPELTVMQARVATNPATPRA